MSLSPEEVIEIAERMLTVEKSINLLSGIERKDEYPPERFFTPIPAGKSKGMALDRKKLDRLFERHCVLHGWDPQTGVPEKTNLGRMGLSEVADRLRSAGILPE